MNHNVEPVLAHLRQRYSDSRTQLLDVQAEEKGDTLHLRGRVLDEATRRALLDALREDARVLTIDDRELVVLRQPQPDLRWVATNLTSLHNGTSFLAEQSSQMLYGARLEVLETQERWGFVRQDDGYLGWTYLPYLTAQEPLPPTHLALHPVSRLREAPEKGSPTLTRLLGGTYVAVTAVNDGWAQVQARQSGWLPLRRLRALRDLPVSMADKRSTTTSDGFTMTGVPYQWGGCSANGIDCSGLAQLLHRWVGVTIPRDADMQFLAGQPVQPPYQPGDLLFFGQQGEARNITHVGISLGGWTMLHASRARNGVYVDDVQAVEHLRDSFYGACTYFAG